MTTVTLTQGATSIIIKAPKYPEVPAHSGARVLGFTWGGGHRVADLSGGTDRRNPVLAFRGLTAAHWASLLGFIQTTCSWSDKLFSYTDPFSVTLTNLRYVSGITEAQSSRGNRWDVDLATSRDITA